jgi:hypothetical protein
MTRKRVSVIGGLIGLFICCGVLALIEFGVAGVLVVRGTDLMYFVWPSAWMLTVTWRSTLLGAMITVVSVALNCAVYALIALLLRACIHTLRKA